MATQRFLSATNPFLPVPTGTVIGYIRDPKKFKLNEYCQYVESPATTGTYYVLNRDHPARIDSEALFAWAPGTRAPQAHTNQGTFAIQEFMLDRVAPSFELDEVTVDMARKFGKWDPIEYEAKAMAQQAMLLRTLRVWGSGPNSLALDTAATWGTSTASAATLSGITGGTWANAQAAAPVIGPSLFEAARRIASATNNAVQPSDLTLVISPTAAIAIQASNEVRDFVKQQASAPEILTKGWDNPNMLWGLPSNLFGFKLVVEDSYYTSGLPNASATASSRTAVKADNSAALLARPGGINAPFGSKAFSTVQLYWYKFDMAVEMEHVAWDKIYKGRVVDYRTVISPAIESGFLIQNILT